MSSAKPYHIFISRVSGEMKKLSEELAADLRAKGITAKIQIDFRQEDDKESTLDLLEMYVREGGCRPVPIHQCPLGRGEPAIDSQVASHMKQNIRTGEKFSLNLAPS
jgi:hypothetical protein